MQPARRAGGAGCLLRTGQGALARSPACGWKRTKKERRRRASLMLHSAGGRVWPPCGLFEASSLRFGDTLVEFCLCLRAKVNQRVAAELVIKAQLFADAKLRACN
jgi:hypothetical protein